MRYSSNVVSVGISIAQKSFKKLVRENLLGFLWVFITPLIYSIFFLLVKQSLSADNSSKEIMKVAAMNAFIGLLLIQIWFQIIQDTANIIRKNKGTLRALSISVYPFILSIIFEAIVHLIIRALIILCAILLLKITVINTSVILWVLIFITLISSAIFLGLILAPWATLFNDVRNILSSSLMPVALLSPIFYFPISQTEGFLFWANQIIPFSALQAVLSDSIFSGATNYLNAVYIWSGISIFGSVFLAIMLKQQTPILLERLGN